MIRTNSWQSRWISFCIRFIFSYLLRTVEGTVKKLWDWGEWIQISNFLGKGVTTLLSVTHHMPCNASVDNNSDLNIRIYFQPKRFWKFGEALPSVNSRIKFAGLMYACVVLMSIYREGFCFLERSQKHTSASSSKTIMHHASANSTIFSSKFTIFHLQWRNSRLKNWIEKRLVIYNAT